MNIEELREYCLSVKGASECFPFDDNILVFKVIGKMFLYIDIYPKDGLFRYSTKCDIERAIKLREQYEGIQPGWHSKKYWNTTYLDSDVPVALHKELIQHSVNEVIKKLSKKLQEEYRNS